MGMTCKTCNHRQRLQIDRDLAGGMAVATIARKYQLDGSSVTHHRDNHLSRQMMQYIQKQQTMHNSNLLKKIDGIIEKAECIFQRNYDKNRDGLALKALDSQRNTIELLAKISYALHQAREAELEAKRQESGEADHEARQKQRERLSVLSIDELKLYHLLTEKISTQDKTKDVVADFNNALEDNPLSVGNPLAGGQSPLRQHKTGQITTNKGLTRTRPVQTSAPAPITPFNLKLNDWD